MEDPVANIYQSVASEEPFFRLVDEFYAGVEKDPILRPLYPDDLSHSKQLLALFLLQRFGGRTTYSQERGHPRMRARHMPFKIGVAERDAWVKHMGNALDKVTEFSPFRAALDFYFQDFATFMINQP
ncbi:MAG: globin [Candidatus Obscuribacterales bacterium]|nr:globin [Candidatus Obscuribacterales bacterium]